LLLLNPYLLKKANKYAAGYDLYSSNTEDLIIKAHSKELVPTGCALAIPHGNYGRIAPRSGLAWKHHLDVGAGVIDSDYRGEIKVIVFNHSDQDFAVKPKSRIAQMIIEKVVNTEIKVTEELEETERGNKGFGSTGVDSDQPLELKDRKKTLEF
jgi:dUTP pyrophosphatase